MKDLIYDKKTNDICNVKINNNWDAFNFKNTASYSSKRSCFESTPLITASKSFSYFATNDITTGKRENRFILNAALNHLEPYGNIEATCDVSKKETMDVKCSQIAKRVTHLRFMGIDSSSLATKTLRILAKVQKEFKGAKKIVFEGNTAEKVLYNSSFYIREYFKLEQIEVICKRHWYSTAEGFLKMNMETILDKCKNIENICLKSPIVVKNLDSMSAITWVLRKYYIS